LQDQARQAIELFSQGISITEGEENRFIYEMEEDFITKNCSSNERFEASKDYLEKQTNQHGRETGDAVSIGIVRGDDEDIMCDYEQTQASIYHLNDMRTCAGAARAQRVEDDIYSDIFSDDEDLTRIQQSSLFVEFPDKAQKGNVNSAKSVSQN
jgi:hypothetical protein